MPVIGVDVHSKIFASLISRYLFCGERRSLLVKEHEKKIADYFRLSVKSVNCAQGPAANRLVPVSSICFHRSKPKLDLLFSPSQGDQKNLKTIGAYRYTESTDLIFKTFKKIIHLVDTIPLTGAGCPSCRSCRGCPRRTMTPPHSAWTSPSPPRA